MVDVFQGLFFDKSKPEAPGLIDNEINVFDKDFFEKLTKYVDCAIFTMRPCEEALYSLEKYQIRKYFSYLVCNEDVEGNYKPDPFGLNLIKKHCPNNGIFYFGDTVDDVKAGELAKVYSYGVILPNAPSVEETKEKLFEFGAIGVIDNKEQILKIACEDIYANN